MFDLDGQLNHETLPIAAFAKPIMQWQGNARYFSWSWEKTRLYLPHLNPQEI